MTSDKRMSEERLDELRRDSDLRANLSEQSADELIAEIDALRADLAVARREAERERDRARTDALSKADAKVLRAAKVLSIKWTTSGQKVDSDDFYESINDIHEAICAAYGVDPIKGFRMTVGDESSPAPIPAQEE